MLRKRILCFGAALLLLANTSTAFAVTSIGSADLIKTEKFTTSDPNFNYNFLKSFSQNGSKYELSNVVYKVLNSTPISREETVKQDECYNGLFEKNAPAEKTLSVNKDGKNVTAQLKNIDYEPITITDRKENVSAYTDYPYSAIKPEADSTKPISYYDSYSKQTVQSTATLQSLDLVEDWNWKDDVNIPITISLYDADYYTFGDNVLIPYSDDSPNFQGHSDDLLHYLKLDTTKYKITGAQWVGDTYKKGEVTYRNAVAKGKRYVARYRANYTCAVNLPNVNGYNAIAHYEFVGKIFTGAVEYKVEAIACYREVSNIIKTTQAIGLSTLALIILTALLILLWLHVYTKGKSPVVFNVKRKAKKARLLPITSNTNGNDSPIPSIATTAALTEPEPDTLVRDNFTQLIQEDSGTLPSPLIQQPIAKVKKEKVKKAKKKKTHKKPFGIIFIEKMQKLSVWYYNKKKAYADARIKKINANPERYLKRKYSRNKSNDVPQTPQLAVRENAIYEIRAAEEIKSADGTVRLIQGQLADTIKTGESSKLSSKLLYHGFYVVKEIVPPEGESLDTTPYFITI